MERKKYAIYFGMTLALGAVVGMLGFFVAGPATHAKAQKIISFDLACLKAHLDYDSLNFPTGGRTSGVDMVTDCEVSNSKLGKAMAKYLSPAIGFRQGMRPQLPRVAATIGGARAFSPTMSVAVGDKVPEGNLDLGFPPLKVNVADRIAGKKVLLVGLPGAFTPT